MRRPYQRVAPCRNRSVPSWANTKLPLLNASTNGKAPPAHLFGAESYYEYITRDKRALKAIRQYAAKNPLRWQLDRHNPNPTANDDRGKEIWNMIFST